VKKTDLINRTLGTFAEDKIILKTRHWIFKWSAN